MKVLLLISTLFSFDTIHLTDSNREPYYFYHKNSNFYTYTYHYGDDGSHRNPAEYVPDVPTSVPSPKHQRSYSFQNEKRNAESRHQPPPIHENDDFSSFDDSSPDAIIYPTNHDNFQRRDSENSTNSKCAFDLCESVQDYPTEYIKNLFDRTRIYDAFFNVTPPDTVTLGNRFGDNEYENLCRSNSRVTYPRSALNKNKIKRYIPNYEEYRQGIKVETCEEKDKPCQLIEMLPFGYETKCEQRFTTVILLALDDDKNPVVDTFLSPSCCVCTFRKTKT